MGKADRKRWDGNVKSMEIISKPINEITYEEVEFLKENYTSTGGILPNSSANGAFHTPSVVAKFIWDVLKDRLPNKSRILEPSVGSGVFLEHAPKDAEITVFPFIVWCNKSRINNGRKKSTNSRVRYY
ncbi:hypothetical protein [Salipaludibacillus sp. CF4.18]|uniref:hypothetical protein n=1 Tax=Salipaludibacillus sp. CF4.18 TaxID=3373081 RepID=UPI003EE4B0F8